jgi:predicted Zn-dependent protease
MRANWLQVGAMSLVFVGGCGLTKVAADLLISPEQEVELGAQVSDELAGEIVIHADPEVQQYLTTLGNDVLAAVEDVPAEYDFSFTVVDDAVTINAFALPGGRIYMYTGLMLQADSEAEIIGVLGHEIAHVIRRHGAQQLVTQLGIDTVLSMALGQNPSDVVALAATIAQTGALLKYSRTHELEADEFGVRYVIDAGWSPYGFIDFFDRLEAMGGSSLPEFLSTHPNPENRVEQLEDILRDYDSVPDYEGDPAALEAIQGRL